MSHIVADRVRETTTTTGTGTINLDGAETKYVDFDSVMADGDTCYYAIVSRSANEWEVGLGTFTSGTPDTLARTAVLAGTNGTSAVSFSAGTKDVFLTLPARVGDAAVVKGDCRFEFVSSSVCRLNRFGGRHLTINGRLEVIPSAGVDLANTTLGSNDTTYYVYAYMSGTTMTLEVSTTAYATDSTNGTKIKSGDATRALVGMVRKTGGNFRDQADIRFVRTWFNDPGIALFVSKSTDTTVSSAPWAELSTSFRLSFLIWSGEGIDLKAWGSFSGSALDAYLGLGVDSTGTPPAGPLAVQTVSTYVSQHVTHNTATLAEGYHFVTLAGGAIGGTATLLGNYNGTAGISVGSGA